MSYNLSRIKAFIGQDQEMMKKMVDIFLENTPNMLSKIQKGMEAQDLKSVSFYAHKLKSSIDNFSISTLEQDIRDIEKFAKEKINLDQLPQLVHKLIRELNKTMAEIKSDFNLD